MIITCLAFISSISGCACALEHIRITFPGTRGIVLTWGTVTGIGTWSENIDSYIFKGYCEGTIKFLLAYLRLLVKHVLPTYIILFWHLSLDRIHRDKGITEDFSSLVCKITVSIFLNFCIIIFCSLTKIQLICFFYFVLRNFEEFCEFSFSVYFIFLFSPF